MPTITLRVQSVISRTVGMTPPRRMKYDVIPQLEPGQLGAALYETFDPLKASLCERAAVLGFPVRIVWRDTRYGREIVTVTRGNATEVAA